MASGLGRCPCRRLSSPSSTVGRLGRTWTTGFAAPPRAPLSESNWKRSIRWSDACEATGRQLRPHDLRHMAASIWLGAGADPQVVQRVLDLASAAMTMDLSGHLIDQNVWDAVQRVGGTTGASAEQEDMGKAPNSDASGA
ncbi:tyrosine-type recombinase/integrase [Lapillicoccus sp.]|uniref:tyrosine-type recombinase/integrase n=1 Tax=Lapillicoccus sp. TaxID=1909287 RepID=UPI003982DFFE